MSARRKADVAAGRGEPAALDPFLPDTWYRVTKAGDEGWPYKMWPWRRKDHDACVSIHGVWEATGTEGHKEVYRLAAMEAANAALGEG